MVFKNNIPQPGDILSTQSQPDLLGNMSQLDTSFGQDHVPFSDLTADNGFHKKVSLLNLATPGGLPGATVKGILYTNSVSSVNQAFFYNGTNNFQITPCLPLRAAVNFSTTGTNMPQTINGTPFNVSSVVRSTSGGVAIYQVNFIVPMPSTNYLFAISGSTNAAPGTLFAGPYTTGQILTASLQISFFNSAAPQDPTKASVMIYGG